MSLCYNKLWKLMIDKKINKTQLHKSTGLSQSTITKLAKNENVNTDVLEKLCHYFKCDISDIVEYNEESNPSATNNKNIKE